jgi:hypothetical protein
MKLQIKLGKLMEARGSLQALSEMELDLSPAFRIAKVIKAFNDVAESADYARNTLLKRAFKVKPTAESKGEYNEGFNEEKLREAIDELNQEVIDIEIQQVKKNKLTRNGELIIVRPAVLADITWLIIDDEPEEDLAEDSRTP